ncbi:serine/threonine-protein phosphatase 6 regulatory ankyrin repeat subunit C-like, partial [Trifolium medium]|nr:serine/threonine-protein phosphatase 6 regulatory ankyrin repeat subunit C-like [Trifolium medium]
GWTSLHVAAVTGRYEIMKKLVKMGALVTEKDSEGYTPFALAVQSDYGTGIALWMLNEGGGNELLTMEINSDDDKGDIPVLLAAIKGY